jgi:zinc protease
MRLRRLPIIACLLLMAAAAAGGAGAPDIRETKLPNGLTILTKEVRVAPVVSVNIFYGVGSRNERTGITGASHLLEHMMFKGSKNYPKGQLEELIRERGGVSNAATWTDFTYYWELLQSDYLELALKLEADRMRGALFDPKDLASEMTVVRSELEGNENSPDTLLWNLVNATAFTAHPYQWPVIGWRPDVEGMTRDDIYGYYQSHYGPNNATVVIVGDIDTAQAVALVRKHFGAIKPIPQPRKVHTQEPLQRGLRRAHLTLAGSSDRVLMGWKIPSGSHPDNYALDLLEQVLSGGRSSRLYQALVETGLATDAYAYSASKTDPSLFYMGATAQEGRSHEELEKALLAEAAKIRAEPPSEEELARAKRQIEASFVFSNDDVRSQAQLIGHFAHTVGLKKLAEYIPSIQKTTAEHVRKAAVRYLVDETRTVGMFTPSGPSAAAAGGGGPAESVQVERERWSTEGWPHYRPATANAAGAVGSAAKPTPAKPAPKAKTAAPAPAPRQRLMKPVRTVLGNGITLIVLSNPANPSISIGGSLRAGSWADAPGKQGTASFAAAMLKRGTTTLNSLAYATAVEEMGASVSFSAGLENTGIGGRCLSRDFEKWLALFADALKDPAFAPEELEKLRRQELSSLAQERESPENLAERALMNRLYPAAHPYHPGTIEENEKSYRAIGASDLEAFHSKRMGPRGMILTVVGDIEPARCRELVEKALGGWRAQSDTSRAAIAQVKAAGPGFEYIRVPDKTETTVAYGWPSALKRSSPDYYAAAVMNDILGGSVLSSRLGKKIRAQLGLVYDVSTGFRASLGAGPWTAALGTNPKSAARAVQELEKEIERMKTAGPTAEEVRQARQYITGVLSLRLATNAGIASFLHSAEFHGLGLDYLNQFRTLYGKVTQAEVREAAKAHLHPEGATLVVAGPDERFSDVRSNAPKDSKQP